MRFLQPTTTGHTAQEEETLFYRGYGQTQINPLALAYYRYERIIQDIAVFCEQIFLTNEGGEDREQSLQYLRSNFLPNGVLEIAYRSDKTLSKEVSGKLEMPPDNGLHPTGYRSVYQPHFASENAFA